MPLILHVGRGDHTWATENGEARRENATENGKSYGEWGNFLKYHANMQRVFQVFEIVRSRSSRSPKNVSSTQKQHETMDWTSHVIMWSCFNLSPCHASHSILTVMTLARCPWLTITHRNGSDKHVHTLENKHTHTLTFPILSTLHVSLLAC